MVQQWVGKALMAIHDDRVEDFDEIIAGKTQEEIVNAIEQDDDGKTHLMHWAAANGRLSMCKAMIQIGGRELMNVVGGTLRETPIHFAVKNNKLQVLHYFLYGGGLSDEATSVADLGLKSAEGMNAFHYACQTGNADVMLLFLENGADPNTPTDGGDSPLMLLVRHGVALSCMRLALQFGADPTYIHPVVGGTVLHLYINTIAGSYSPKEPGYWFVKYGGDVMLRTKDKDGLIPEELAIKIGNKFGARMLTEISIRQKLWAIGHIVLGALRVPAATALVHFLGWLWGGLLGMAVCYSENHFVIAFGRGDHLFGAMWGVLVTFFSVWLGLLAPHVSNILSFVFLCLCVAVSYLSVQVAGTDPEYVEQRDPLAGGSAGAHGDGSSHDMDEQARLLLEGMEEGDDGSGGAQSKRKKLSSNLENMMNDDICFTCLVNRKANNAVHCPRCDRCIKDYNHHCLFGMNCVGAGNRRQFVLWCGCAAIASFIFGMVCIWVENYVVCPEATGWVYGQIAVQMCTFHSDARILTFLAVLAFGTAFGMGGCGMSHMVFVGSDTTAYFVSNGFFDEDPPISNATKCTRMKTFLMTGKFVVKVSHTDEWHPKSIASRRKREAYRERVGSSTAETLVTEEPFEARPMRTPQPKGCCSHDHDHSHSHSHSHGHNHDQGHGNGNGGEGASHSAIEPLEMER